MRVFAAILVAIIVVLSSFGHLALNKTEAYALPEQNVSQTGELEEVSVNTEVDNSESNANNVNDNANESDESNNTTWLDSLSFDGEDFRCN